MIKAWPQQERPRERCIEHGPHVLTDAELLAVILGTGHACLSETAVGQARRLLDDFDDWAGLDRTSLDELQCQPGIGPAKAVRIACIFEIARRYRSNRRYRGEKFNSSEHVYQHYADRYIGLEKESFYVLLLDKKNRKLSEVLLSVGTLDTSLVHPREAFAPAIRAGAASVIFVHNHPSGDPQPSQEDSLVTQRLQQAGELLGIPMLDHVIVGDNSYYSFSDHQSLDMPEPIH